MTQCALDAPVAVWYNLVDSGADPYNREHNFGLLDDNYFRKPAFHALKVITAAAVGRSFVGLIGNTPAGLHIMKLEDAAQSLFIAWNSEAGRSVSLNVPAASLLTVTNYVGTPLNGAINPTNTAIEDLCFD